MTLFLVAGAPGSGKTTFVEAERGPDDVVVDLDALRVALGGKDHDLDDPRLDLARSARDAILADLEEHDGDGWIVASAPSKRERDRYRNRFPGLEVLVLETPKEVVLERIAGRRPEGSSELVAAWWTMYERDDRDVVVEAEGRKERRTMRKKNVEAVGVKAVKGRKGVFDAYVAVFGNVDYQGDRIIPGAFGKSLERWKASGDPIPVVFSHRWDDLDAHIGIVEEAVEVLPGSKELPAELSGLGGLRVRMVLDVDDDDAPHARRVAKLLERRSLKEFSFAYDVLDEKLADDGANDLLELELGEVGPTLKGANPATMLLGSAKSLDEELDLFDQAVERLRGVKTGGSATGVLDPDTVEGDSKDPELEAGDGNGGEPEADLDDEKDRPDEPDQQEAEAERARAEAELDLLDLE